MTRADDQPRLPPFELARIRRRREQIYQFFLAQLPRTSLSGQLLAFSGRVALFLKIQSREAVFESLRHWVDVPVDSKELFVTAWRLAANLDSLRAGIPVRPWSSQPRAEWAAAVISKLVFERRRDKTAAYRVFTRVQTGSACGMLVNRVWTPRTLRLISTRIGFSRFPSGKYPYTRPTDLIGLYMAIHLEPGGIGDLPRFFRIAASSSLISRNRQDVLAVRCRAEPCPRGLLSACHQCSVGYVECPAAVHRLTYVRGFCTMCECDGAFFDPDLSNSVCVECLSRNR